MISVKAFISQKHRQIIVSNENCCFNLFICKGIKAKLVIGVLDFCGGENLRELGKQQVGQDIISPLNKKYNIKQMSDENKEKYQFGDQ